MAVLGAATLELNADSAKLEQDLGRAVQNAAAFGTAIGEVLGRAVSSGAEKLARMVEQAIEVGDQLSKLSQKTGMTVEFLSELRVSAQLADVSMGALKNSIAGLYEKLSQAGRTDGRAKSAFEAIGLDIEKLRTLKPDELFRTVTEQLSKYKDDANRAAIQTAILGQTGKELSPLINEMGKTTALARELGLTLDKDTAEAANRFKDNLTASKLATEAMGQRIAAALLPTMEKLSGYLVETAKNTERLDTVTRAADAGLKLFASGASIISSVFEIAGGQIARMAAIASSALKGDFGGAWELYKSTITDVGAQIGEAAAKISLIWDGAGNTAQAGAERNGEKLAASALAARDKIAKARKEIDVDFQAILKTVQIQNEADAATQDYYRRRGQALQDEAERLKAIQESVIEVESAYAQALDRMRKGNLGEEENVATRIEEVGLKAKEVDDFARRMGLTFTSAFEAAATGGQKLSEVLKGVGRDIAAIVLRQTVTEPLGKAVSNTIGSIIKDAFGGGKAEGGPLEQGKWYIAGEHGPEPIWGGGPGAYAMGYASGGGSSQVSIVQNIQVDSRSDQASIMAAMRAAKDAAVAEVADACARGGSYAATVRGR